MTNLQPPEQDINFCARARDLMIGALEGDAAAELDRAFLDTHLAECANCRSYRQTMQHLAISLKNVQEIPVPAGLSDRILERIATEAPNSTVISGRFGWKKAAPIAAAVLVVALAIPLALNILGPKPDGGPEIAQGNFAGEMPLPGPGPEEMSIGVEDPFGDEPDQSMQPPPQGLMPRQAIMPQQQGESPAGMYNNGASAYQGQGPLSGQGQGDAWGGNASMPNGGHQGQGYGGPMDGSSSNGRSQTAYPVDPSMMASAGTSTDTGMDDPSSAFASENEGDLYYDPVSTLVGF
ncbi:MAG TPA: anti-sigma factor [Coleofasciculaceae cyanobacterium]|jgi:hypothetical protein